MSQLFSHAKSCVNKLEKYERSLREIHGADYDTTAAIEQFINREDARFERICILAQRFGETYQRVTKLEITNYYFISVRPKPGVKFEEFYKLTYKYVNRAFMISYKLSFEQKSIEGNGDGFHVHIVCSTKHRSKGECLRDTISSFRKICEENCIDVQTTKNPESIVNNYLIEYKSEDEHKSPTREGDKVWRKKLGLQDLYDNDLSGCLSSPGTAIKKVEPFIVEIN